MAQLPLYVKNGKKIPPGGSVTAGSWLGGRADVSMLEIRSPLGKFYRSCELSKKEQLMRYYTVVGWQVREIGKSLILNVRPTDDR